MSYPTYLNGWQKLADEVDEELARIVQRNFQLGEARTPLLTEPVEC